MDNIDDIDNADLCLLCMRVTITLNMMSVIDVLMLL